MTLPGNFAPQNPQKSHLKFKKIAQQITRLQHQKFRLKVMKRQTYTTARKARTRTLIQLGGLLSTSGILQDFDIHEGEDLQLCPEHHHKAHQLLGALLQLKDQIEAGDLHFDLCALKAKDHLKKYTKNKSEKPSKKTDQPYVP